MTCRSLRLFFLVAAVGSAAGVVLDLSSRQATAASISLDSGVAGGSTYSLSFLSNQTITTDAGVQSYVTTSPLPALGTSVSGLATAVVTPTGAPGSQSVQGYGWTPSTATSAWIGPNSAATATGTALSSASFFSGTPGFSATLSSPQGFYYYTTTFSLSPGPLTLSGGLWASDNQGVEIFLNGTQISTQQTNNQFSSLTSYTFGTNGVLNAGTVNTLTFVTWNECYQPAHASPTGIDIQGTISTPTVVPEPTAIAVVASGAPLMGVYWAVRRRRRRVSS